MSTFCGNDRAVCMTNPTCSYHREKYRELDEQLKRYTKESQLDIIKMIVGFGVLIGACTLVATGVISL